jgi:hypothetical protein
MTKRKTFYQDEIHKNVARDRFIRSFKPEAVEKLRAALEVNKKQQEKRHE